jgi:hypothetical protein
MCVTREQWPQSGRLRMQSLHLGDKSLRGIRKLEQFWPDKKGAAAVPVENNCRVSRCVRFSGGWDCLRLALSGTKVHSMPQIYHHMTRCHGRSLPLGQ